MGKSTKKYVNKKPLRYGENPHQKAWVIKEKTKDPLAITKFKQVQGKKLSFNNYLDIDAALDCISFIGRKKPACVVIKHTNPCGASQDKSIKKAFKKAWAGDSLAAFGSVIALNRSVSGPLAKYMLANNRFFEVLICPELDKKAQNIFSTKKNLRVLINPALKNPKPSESKDLKQIRGAMLLQEPDTYKLKPKNLKVVTSKKPTKIQLQDLLFSWEICRASKSNCVCLVKGKKLIANAVGQQDRLRCCRLAIEKASKNAKNSVAASDGFFPFPDGPQALIKSGVRAIIQPGGSIRDQQTINLCNQNKITMVFTGIRCFKH